MSKPLSERRFCPVLQEVGHFEVGGAVPLFGGFRPANVPEEVYGEPLLEAVLFHAVRLRALLLGLRLLRVPVLQGVVFLQDGLVGVGGAAAVVLGPEAHEVAALILGKAMPFPRCQIHGEAVFSVLVEGAEADQALAAVRKLVLFDYCGIFRLIVNEPVKIDLIVRRRHAPSPPFSLECAFCHPLCGGGAVFQAPSP